MGSPATTPMRESLSKPVCIPSRCRLECGRARFSFCRGWTRVSGTPATRCPGRTRRGSWQIVTPGAGHRLRLVARCIRRGAFGTEHPDALAAQPGSHRRDGFRRRTHRYRRQQTDPRRGACIAARGSRRDRYDRERPADRVPTRQCSRVLSDYRRKVEHCPGLRGDELDLFRNDRPGSPHEPGVSGPGRGAERCDGAL